jgi:pyruvate kinase
MVHEMRKMANATDKKPEETLIEEQATINENIEEAQPAKPATEEQKPTDSASKPIWEIMKELKESIARKLWDDEPKEDDKADAKGSIDKKVSIDKKAPDYEIIITMPPFSKYYNEIAINPFVNAIRYNSATKTKKSPKKVLDFFKDNDYKETWVDLKCRQLRVASDSEIPTKPMEITHKISVDTPVEVVFNDGEAYAQLVEIEDGYKLKFDPKTPKTKFGQGASLNITDDSFEIHGYFTRKDMRYIKEAKKRGMHNYMLSYVEEESDIQEMLKLDPDAKIVAKIESMKGLEFVKNIYPKYKDKVRLMAATGDLYVEVDQPHHIKNALEEIIKADPNAIVASRILSSCKNPGKMPECSEILSVNYLVDLGYKAFMLGDEFCLDRFDLDHYVYTPESSLPLRSALGLLEAILKNK